MDLPTGDPRTLKFIENVAILTTDGPIGPNVMTAAWVYRISASPAMIAICISKDRYSYQNINKTKEIGVNYCSSEQNVLASVAGGSSGKNIDKISVLKELGFKFYKAKKIKTLMVEDAALNLECKIVNEIKTGDHVTLIAEVIEASANDKPALIYASGKFWKLGENVQKPSPDVLDKIRKLLDKHKK